jgi:hypothetical protein
MIGGSADGAFWPNEANETKLNDSGAMVGIVTL